ncbi:MAG: DUF1116 domain-containing protein [PVC group bacterium]
MVDIAQANEQALKKLLEARPFWVDIQPASECVPGMKKNLILHAGPPVTWDRMCGPQRGATIGALIYEGMAKTPEEAEELAASGEIEFDPCHHHDTVGPMAGIVCPSMPMIVTEDEVTGNRAYQSLNEGIGKVLRMGAYDDDVIKRLKWMERVLGPVLRKAIRQAGKIDLKNIMAQAIQMGDELHNRTRAASYILFTKMAPYILETLDQKDLHDTIEALKFQEANIHNFLGFAMTSAKVSLMAAENIEGSTMVTVMARNGTDWGIQVSGLGKQWFTCESPVPEVLLFPGFTKKDVGRDIGDSAIMETYGIGGCAIAAAPAIVLFVGGTYDLAVSKTMDMYEITLGENNVFQIPSLNFRGTPTGIDIVKVVKKNLPPFIDTGVAHKDAGIGQVGAGLCDAPMDVFKKAVVAFSQKYAK